MSEAETPLPSSTLPVAGVIRVEPTRVLVLIDTLLAGGAERLAVELACALDRSRWSPHVVVSRYTGPLESLLHAADVPFTVLGRTRRLQVLPWVRAHRLARDAQLIHAHKFGSNVWGALLSRTARVPLVVHEHNFSASAGRMRAVLDRRWVAPAAERVLCVSDSVAAVERSVGVPEAKLQVVRNGVRLEAAWPRASARDELELDHDEFVVGIVGRLRPEKAHDVLLHAQAVLRADGRKVRVCVVGDGPCEPALRELAATLGIEDSVTWAGERPDAARLAGAFDASVICSHWEGLPLAALEAMAAGVPLVATAVGGLPDLAVGEAAVLVPPASPGELAAAIARLQDEPERTRAIAAAGQRRVREEYGFRRMVARIEETYAEVLAARGSFGALLASDVNVKGRRPGEAA